MTAIIAIDARLVPVPVSYTHLDVYKRQTVVHILENREYTGCLVNFKTEKLSYIFKSCCMISWSSFGSFAADKRISESRNRASRPLQSNGAVFSIAYTCLLYTSGGAGFGGGI